MARGQDALGTYMESAPHVGNSDEWRRRAGGASGRLDSGHYNLVPVYFSASYFSTSQAIDLDSIRYAIDQVCSNGDQDWALAAWLSAAGAVVNAP